MNTDSRCRGFCCPRVRGRFLVPLLVAAWAQAAPLASLPNVNPLLPYATFGSQYVENNATTIGNAGIANGGNLVLGTAVSISGRLDLGIGASMSGSATIAGGTFAGLDFAAAQSLVSSASSALAGLPPTATYGSLVAATTLGATNGVDDVQVFNLGTVNLAGSNALTLVGDPGDFFVLNTPDVNLNGHAVIGSAAQAARTWINLYDDSGSDLGHLAWANSHVYGTVLIPHDSAQVMGTVSGAIWSGSGTLTLMTSAAVIGDPLEAPSVPDTPQPGWMLAIACGILAVVRYYWRSAPGRRWTAARPLVCAGG